MNTEINEKPRELEKLIGVNRAAALKACCEDRKYTAYDSTTSSGPAILELQADKSSLKADLVDLRVCLSANTGYELDDSPVRFQLVSTSRGAGFSIPAELDIHGEAVIEGMPRSAEFRIKVEGADDFDLSECSVFDGTTRTRIIVNRRKAMESCCNQNKPFASYGTIVNGPGILSVTTLESYGESRSNPVDVKIKLIANNFYALDNTPVFLVMRRDHDRLPMGVAQLDEDGVAVIERVPRIGYYIRVVDATEYEDTKRMIVERSHTQALAENMHQHANLSS